MQKTEGEECSVPGTASQAELARSNATLWDPGLSLAGRHFLYSTDAFPMTIERCSLATRVKGILKRSARVRVRPSGIAALLTGGLPGCVRRHRSCQKHPANGRRGDKIPT